MVASLVDHSTEGTEALAKVRVNARDFDLFIEFYSIKIVLQSAARDIIQWDTSLRGVVHILREGAGTGKRGLVLFGL